MKTLLIIAQNPELADTLRAGLNLEQFKIVHRVSIEDAEPLLAHKLADVCLLDVEQSDVQAVWMLERLRRRNTQCPILVCTGAKQPEWEEAAYLQGADFVLNKPVRIRVLQTILDRIFASATPMSASPAAASTAVTGLPQLETAVARIVRASQTLS